MKFFFVLSLLVSTVLCSYLSGLERSFAEADFKMIDLYFTIPTTEVDKLLQIVQIAENQVANGQAKNLQDFIYKEASLAIKMNGQETLFENVTFKTGGMYARSNDKVGYNIKLNEKFLGRKQIRIRPDPNDMAYMRSKISCDIANRIGLPSIQSAYARLYINNEYWGLYTVMDTIKTSWVKQTFKPAAEEVTNLIQCKYDGMTLKPGSESLCMNANEDYPDMTSFNEFVRQVSSATTIEELEKIMDVDVFLKFMAMEWLIGSFDHFLVLGHNFYFYKRESDNKWVIIEYDYDNTFGNGVSFPVYWTGKRTGASSQNNNQNNQGWNNWGGNQNNVINYSFAEWELDIPIIKTLVLDNPDRFKGIVREVLISAFNPTILGDHIDQIKQFLLPYVKEDTTPGKDGRLPGRVNKRGNPHNSSVSEFERNIEGNSNGTEGVKSWIKGKFEVACKQYNFDQSEILSESLKYTPKSFNYSSGSSNNNNNQWNTNNNNTNSNNSEGNNNNNQWNNNNNNNNNQWDNNNNNNNNQWNNNNNQWNNNNNQWNNNNNNNQWDNNNNNNNNQWNNNNNQWNNNNNQWNNNNNQNNLWNDASDCWSDVLGYSCCNGCSVVYTDKDGKWGVEHGQWCGIKQSICQANSASGQCYGATTGKYPCCQGCIVVTTDKNGRWGVENNAWCSISYSC
ncbi:hypothetical protein BCR36DRAFT_581274 [Piromyces finnis]|uniref:CBM10 domain-containing protein n=1 Tax=Piromyces finnis TaxID=1754191 RepID=A0A1Y1VFQ5_9FUNG|nr:hypothetical protein BCR36DRAFT_581274 [Piromyces finnis]|eukprot:ORX55228.1 hypothetical protein BCR36DRAFT_581274 [Piromyces finnis]